MRASAALSLALAALASGCAAVPPAAPDIVARAVEYRDGDTVLEGWLAYDPSRTGGRPGVLVIHEWWGLGDHAKRKAEALARLGYVAFACDMYGKGRMTDDPAKAGKWAGELRGKPLGRSRAAAGLGVLAAEERVDRRRLGAIGFCFGGTVALELAYSGADLRAVVSFHGSLPAPNPDECWRLKARVLACHGAEDGFVSAEALAGFEQGMREAGADWALVKYGGAVHSFTNPDADRHGVPGVAYHAAADRRSWAHMREFLAGAFGE